MRNQYYRGEEKWDKKRRTRHVKEEGRWKRKFGERKMYYY